MPVILWDASALVKRYVPESGSPSVDAIFTEIPMSQMVLTFTGYAETFAILLRRLNQGIIRQASFTMAMSALESDFLFNSQSILLSVDDSAILSSLPLIRKHNLNSTDALILTLFQRFHGTAGSSAVLVSADKRLLRAAAA